MEFTIPSVLNSLRFQTTVSSGNVNMPELAVVTLLTHPMGFLVKGQMVYVASEASISKDATAGLVSNQMVRASGPGEIRFWDLVGQGIGSSRTFFSDEDFKFTYSGIGIVETSGNYDLGLTARCFVGEAVANGSGVNLSSIIVLR